MSERFIYPVDTDLFVNIRERGKLYVDKTDMVYDIVNKSKKGYEWFYKMMLYIVFTSMNAIVDCEVKGILDRSDVVVQTPKDVFVIELKVDDTVDKALKQIDDRGYLVKWSADGRNVMKCGVRISSKTRNIMHWRITDAAGNKIAEKRFK